MFPWSRWKYFHAKHQLGVTSSWNRCWRRLARDTLLVLLLGVSERRPRLPALFKTWKKKKKQIILGNKAEIVLSGVAGRQPRVFFRVKNKDIIYRWHFTKSQTNFQLMQSRISGQQRQPKTIIYLRKGISIAISYVTSLSAMKAFHPERVWGSGDDG